jgi:hypothetical protein
MEGKKKGYVTDRKAVNVPDTTFYHRRVIDGSLVAAAPEETGAKPEANKAD